MSESSPGEMPDRAAVLESMTLLATLSTAEDVRESVADRRAGRDPSAQAPSAVATVRLQEARETLMELLMQLVLGRVPLERNDEDQLAHAVRQFDLLMKVRRAERLVKTMHQHLLSLYPEVSESLVEEARRLHDDLQSFLETGTVSSVEEEEGDLSMVLERGISFAVWTRHEV